MTTVDAQAGFSVADFVYQLQLEQLRHDESFHKDVVLLPLAERVKHMALHNGKYVAYFFEAADAERFAAVLTDAFIITLATANTINQDLGKAVAGIGKRSTAWLRRQFPIPRGKTRSSDPTPLRRDCSLRHASRGTTWRWLRSIR